MKRLINSDWPVNTIAGLQFGLGVGLLFVDLPLGIYVIVLSFFPLALGHARRQGFVAGWGAARLDTIALMAAGTKHDWDTEEFIDAVNTHDREMMKATMTKREFNRIDNQFDRHRAASDGSHDAL